MISLAVIAPPSGADAATTVGAPVDLGTAAGFGILASSTVTNTGPTVVSGDVGVSPGSSITGFSPGNGTYTGTLHQTDAAAGQAQADTTTAFNTAAALTPTTSGVSELNGLSLAPGVYSGGALDLADTGALTLAGTADSVWVFQAASTLTIGSGTRIIMTGGASACNVFWEVGSSATIGTAAQFLGTVLAHQSITATTGATVAGRLLANTGAVTLDTNTISVPTGCSPTITSGTPPTATVGTPYAFTVTATGTPTPTFTVTSGSLPAGLSLNGATGAITGVPAGAGSSTFTITADNGNVPAASASYTVTTRPSTPTTPPASGGASTPVGQGSTVAPPARAVPSRVSFTG